MMNYLPSLESLLWLLMVLILLVFFQRTLHREIQGVFLILTRNPGLTQTIFAIIFFPGVFLHELSHFLAAKLLFVPTGNFSLAPRAQANGMLRLGYVETASGGFIRDSLIGAAPLVTGSFFIALAGIYKLQLLPLWDLIRLADWSGFWTRLVGGLNVPDFWIWFYLIFTISSTMMPSASDRHAWLTLGLVVCGLLGVAILAGAGPWMLAHLTPPFNSLLRTLTMIFSLSCVLHVVLIIPFLLVRRILSKFTGLEIK
jgi:hypothetical protein